MTPADRAREGLRRYVAAGGCKIDIWWLVGVASEMPVGDADSPSYFLSDREREVFAHLRFAKRRQEWLLGRWTAKRLYQRCPVAHPELPMRALSVANDPDGAPYLLVDGEGRLPLSLSISHRHEHAFCALASSSLCAVGADVERVEPRDPIFAHDFFTPSECALVSRCPAPFRDTLVTILWSAKEAVLKALRYGLRADTRQVQIGYMAEFRMVPLPGGSPEDELPKAWWQLAVSTAWPEAAHIAAWCAVGSGYVYTLAIATTPGSDSPDSTPVL
jgi:4'-phosphopantetheinyl transferase